MPGKQRDARMTPAGPEGEWLRARIAKNPYRDWLAPIANDVVRIALANVQIRDLLVRQAAAGGFARRLSRQGREDARTLALFLEHMAFASPGFLATVGEDAGRLS